MSVAPAPTAEDAGSIAATLPAIARLPGTPALMGAALLLGLATSLAGPYMSLFAVERVGMSPLQLGFFLTLNALSAVGVSTLLGRWSDTRAERKPIVFLTLGAGLLAYLALASVQSIGGVMATGVLVLSVSAAAFPQLFALARAALAGAPGDLPEKAVTVLRAVFSLAWVVGPGVGAAVLSLWSFQGVFWLAAACYALALLPLLGLRAEPGPRAEPGRPHKAQTPAKMPASEPAAAPQRPLGWVAAAFTLYGMAMHMGMVMFALFITQTLRGSEGQVGFLVGWCALLEIPVMLAFVLARRLNIERLIAGSLLLFALHFVLIYLSNGMPLLVVTQALRAVVLAVMAGLGMTYFQQLMPGRFSAATTLFSNTSVVGSMLSGLVAGAYAQLFGYRAVFLLCALLALLAWAILFGVTRTPLHRPQKEAC